MNESFVFYESYAKGIRTLPPDQQLQLLDAVIDYMLYGQEPELEGVAYGMFCLIVPTATAAKKRHQDRQKAANSRWHKQEEAPPAPPKPRETPPEPSEPAGQQYHLGKFHNVFFRQAEYEALQKQLGEDFDQSVDRFSRYKMSRHLTLLHDRPALLYFLEHGNIPKGMFERESGG